MLREVYRLALKSNGVLRARIFDVARGARRTVDSLSRDNYIPRIDSTRLRCDVIMHHCLFSTPVVIVAGISVSDKVTRPICPPYLRAPR